MYTIPTYEQLFDVRPDAHLMATPRLVDKETNRLRRTGRGGGFRRGGTIRPERRARRPSAPTSVGRTQDGPGREPYAVASLTTAVHSRIGITLFFFVVLLISHECVSAYNHIEHSIFFD